jgi:hypothetical protein
MGMMFGKIWCNNELRVDADKCAGNVQLIPDGVCECVLVS